MPCRRPVTSLEDLSLAKVEDVVEIVTRKVMNGAGSSLTRSPGDLVEKVVGDLGEMLLGGTAHHFHSTIITTFLTTVSRMLDPVTRPDSPSSRSSSSCSYSPDDLEAILPLSQEERIKLWMQEQAILSLPSILLHPSATKDGQLLQTHTLIGKEVQLSSSDWT